MKSPLRVCVTGAAGQIGYSLVIQLCKGDAFGDDQPLQLTLLDITPCLPTLKGVIMELEDCALPLLDNVIGTDKPMEAFEDVDAVFLVGSAPYSKGMERRDMLKNNVPIFKEQGEALDKVAKKSVKVLAVANPANTIAFICSHFAPSIPKQNFSAMTRLDLNRSQSMIASRLKVPVTSVANCIVWGNHSSTQFPDVTHAKIQTSKGESSVYQAIADDDFLKGDFIDTVRRRWLAIFEARGRTSCFSAAKAACDQMRDWFHGTAPGQHVSMAVVSDGSYGTSEGIFFSFPVTITDGQYSIVQDLPLNEFAREKIKVTNADLCEERNEASAVF